MNVGTNRRQLPATVLSNIRAIEHAVELPMISAAIEIGPRHRERSSFHRRGAIRQ